VIRQLRAHHFLCLTTFAGKGYSPDFVANMTCVWQAARAGTIGPVQAVARADAICQACPHLQDREAPESCRFHESIAGRDRKMIAAMGWEENQQVVFEEVIDDVHERHADLMEQVCGGCDWVPICSRRHFTLRLAEQVEPGASSGPLEPICP